MTYLDGDEEKCPKCGWDFRPNVCVVCKMDIHPRSSDFGSSIHTDCEERARREQDPDGFDKDFDEYLMSTYGRPEDHLE
jgi:hypothetical protein